LNLRLFFLFEKETWFPVIAFFPVRSQTRDIIFIFSGFYQNGLQN